MAVLYGIMHICLKKGDKMNTEITKAIAMIAVIGMAMFAIAQAKKPPNGCRSWR